MTCSIEGCSRNRLARGWCSTHYKRWRSHGDPAESGRVGGVTTHGLTHSPEYTAWVDMKQRCTNPRNPSWGGYGGRGISACPEWQESFIAFYEHIGPRPGSGYSVDRIDNEGNYAPGNVRWATAAEQARNRRPRQKAAA